MSKNNKKHEEDVASLCKVIEQVNIAQNVVNVPDRDSILIALSEIGKLLHDISWDQENPECIRNKHGYTSRYKKDENKKNINGAKLDFETLSHLEDVVQDLKAQSMIFTNPLLLSDSLNAIKEKAEFILNPQSNRTRTNDKEMGVLRIVSAYQHDLQSVHTLIQLIETVKTPLYENLDLNSQIDRYWLGYFFAKFGETAKEISDFVKTDKDNVIKSLFTKIGDYRQEVKDHPHIVYDHNNNKLLQMKHQFDKAKPILEEFLTRLYSALDDSSMEKYQDFNNAFLNEGSQDEIVTKLEKIKIMSGLFDRGISNIKDKVTSLTVSIQRNVLLLERYEAELEEAKTNKSNDLLNKSVQPLAPQTKISKQIKTFAGLLRRLLKQHVVDDQLITNLELTQDKFIELLEKENTTKEYLEGKAKELYDTYNKILVKVSDSDKETKLSNFCDSILDNQSIDINAKINTSKSKIKTFSNLIETNKQDLVKWQEWQKEEDQYTQDYSNSSLSTEDKTIQVQPTTANEVDKKIKLISKINHELEMLDSIERSPPPEKIEYVRKLCIGFIGKYNAELLKEEGVLEYISQNPLFHDSIRMSIITRNKVIMHGTSNESELIVSQTSQSHLLPWQQSYEAMNIILLHHKDCKDLLLSFLPQIAEWKEGGFKEEQDIYIKWMIMRSYSCLMRYEETIKIFNEVEIQNYIKDKDHSPFTKLLILTNALEAMTVFDNSSKVCELTVSCIHLIEGMIEKFADFEEDLGICCDVSVLEEQKSLFLTQILLYDKSLPIDIDVDDLQDDLEKLTLADNYLENAKYNDALGIIEPILADFEKVTCNKNNFFIGYNCYKLMSMYHRCQGTAEQALSFLQKAQGILAEYEDSFKIGLGGRVKFDYAQNIYLQSAMTIIWGKQLMLNNQMDDAQFQFKEGLKLGIKALQEYRTMGEDHYPLKLANVHLTLAEGYALSGIIQSKDLSKFVEINLNIVESYLSKVTDADTMMQVCEIQIGIAEIYHILGNQNKYFYYLLLAHKNEHWEVCSDYLKVPKIFQVIKMPDPDTLQLQVLLSLDPNTQLTIEQRKSILTKITKEVDIRGLATIFGNKDIVNDTLALQNFNVVNAIGEGSNGAAEFVTLDNLVRELSGSTAYNINDEA